MIDAHAKLDTRIQKWIFNQGWYNLREIQCKSIDPILAGDTDVLISASTAAGKTEAFFLPAISKMINGEQSGVSILYISPLKALINDQDRRLESLVDLIDLNVTPWHGDSPKGRKNKLKKSPSGIVLITPESLESMLIRDAGWVKQAFSKLEHIVIDEFHAFLGTERGHHLVSLLHRLEHLLGRLESPIPRTALSATLGNIEDVPVLLRPNQSLPCQIIRDSQSTTSLKVQIKGYVEPKEILEEGPESAEIQVCRDLFKFCRGNSHLVFANSRKRTESLAATLTDFCDEAVVPNEFFPHHGSLAKELREDLERRLQSEKLPTTAICTMTLELGIDIGKVNSVIQVTAPHSVSSLRQRMGRSGRRGGPSVLRMLITENELEVDSDVVSKLRLQLVQSLAMIRLLIRNKWYEPADTEKYHFSTLLHQILSVVAQWGGVRADQLFTLLCKDGVFQKVSVNHFKALLMHMGQQDLITQLGSGELSLGLAGERLVSHYSFYAVFKTPEEYRVLNGDKTLGSLPVDSLIMTGQHIVFGGKRWKVLDVDPDKKIIRVEYARGGQAPKFGGGGLAIHDEIRKEMFQILLDGDYRIPIGSQKIDFVDANAKELFTESVEYFNAAGLANKSILQVGKSTCIFTWMGDKTVNTIAALLINLGYEVGNFAGVLIVEDAAKESIEISLKQLLLNGLPTEQLLSGSVRDKLIDKFDEYLSEDILALNFGSAAFNIEKAKLWLENVVVK
ncbi:ATP-dependent helicase Lhr and Lhr-like helicase [Vibrio crassostreae]|uniref:DEAD/DEAH box helicase n=1 Tax=Vibrio crassostreae TaxID=246167 RepID=UPI001B30A066|nr:DEAD/DEAH box helicase [Vibrio crassostreae]CAK1939324.1 ATP-dependent helicase Lhr and Lhr-like helicase [Vibrio crassostreae]CAK1940837.1 ATP-dependent helicase Lhr and Lhr-like helicase [Vibrio crassostreae]CAK1941811.1 ATP-dependent helicase Lhr and Lhr-like helicase [Vibrio crassostreae]CAK1943211.1 ATP-dependent helicase Lhr and Lhr-like helicase [Vibrio crassostreae]CAK1944539.1 ATP-dependent helicase Lhr and Lhr-like helicase [Vibrio crassostreae]